MGLGIYLLWCHCVQGKGKFADDTVAWSLASMGCERRERWELRYTGMNLRVAMVVWRINDSDLHQLRLLV
jgi:hypothetical protein